MDEKRVGGDSMTEASMHGAEYLQGSLGKTIGKIAIEENVCRIDFTDQTSIVLVDEEDL